MTSGKLPYYQRYPRDYIADTMTLTLEEHGAYNLLLDYQWLHGFVPKSPEILGKIWRISPTNARRLWATLADFFPADETGQRRNDRMERERQKADSRSDRGRGAAEERWRKHRLSNAQASDKHMLDDAIPDPEAEAEPETEKNAAPRARDAAAVRAELPPTSHPAFDGFLRASRNPDAFVAELRAMHQGLRGDPVPWPVIGRTLEELAVDGGPCTSVRLRAFARRIIAGEPSREKPDPYEAARRRLEAENPHAA